MESDELREMVEETYELARRNNKMLRSMRRAAVWGGVVKILIWAIILGIPVWLYYSYMQPIMGDVFTAVQQLQQAGTQMQQVGNQVQDLGANLPLEQVQKILESIPGLQNPSTQ